MTTMTTPDETVTTDRPSAARGWFLWVPLARLRESVHNPRRHFDEQKLQELAQSIAEQGIVEPLVVRPVDVDDAAGDYEIVAGARRYRAAQLARLDQVPCIVREYSDEDLLELFIVENVQRDDLAPLEQARGFKQLLEANPDKYSAATIATKVGMSPAWVWDRLKLLDLVPEAQELLEQGKITVGHAIILARLKPEDQERAIDVSADALFTHTIRGLHFDGDRELEEPEDPYADAKPVSIREFEAWVANHVRFDVTHAAKAQPLEFESLAEQVDEAQQAPGRGKKVVSITYNSYVQPSAKDEADRTYGPQSWRRADGREDSQICEHSVLGVVVVGPKQGRAFDVCIARDRCRVHFAEEIKAKEKAAAARAKGDTKTAERVERRQEQSWERQQRERKERLAIWAPMKEPVMRAALAQVTGRKALTPAQVRYFEQDNSGEIVIRCDEARRVLGKHWFEHLAAAALVTEVFRAEYVDSFDAFVAEVATPLGLDLKPLLAARDAHSPKPAEPAAKGTKKPAPAKKARRRK